MNKKYFALFLLVPIALILLTGAGQISPLVEYKRIIMGPRADLWGGNLNVSNQTWYTASGVAVAQLDNNGTFSLADANGNPLLVVDPVAESVSIYSTNGNALATVNGANLELFSAKLTSALNGNNQSFTNIARVVSTNFVGNGASLTNIPATALTGLTSLAFSGFGQLNVPNGTNGAAFFMPNMGTDAAALTGRFLNQINIMGMPAMPGLYTNFVFNAIFPGTSAGTNIVAMIFTNNVATGVQVIVPPFSNNTKNTYVSTGSFRLSGNTNMISLAITNNSSATISGLYCQWSMQLMP